MPQAKPEKGLFNSNQSCVSTINPTSVAIARVKQTQQSNELLLKKHPRRLDAVSEKGKSQPSTTKPWIDRLSKAINTYSTDYP